jgi:uncharacterized iron-regulated membrane protein
MPRSRRGAQRWRCGGASGIVRTMTAFRLLHRWVGIAAGLVLLGSAGTGLLLLLKKDYAWLQPQVVRGEPGPVERLQPLPAVYAAVFALGLPQFRSEADIARIDFRPAQRVHKVVSVHEHLEVQVCATTLRTSGPLPRRSDWLEQLHDGSWFGDPVHDWLMPAAACALLFLAVSGYVMWLWPKLRRRARGAGAAG